MQAHRLVSIPDDVIDEVQFEISSAPYDSIVFYIRRAIIEFCETSHYWQEEIGPLVPRVGVDTYEIDAPRGSAIVSVVGVSWEQGEITRSDDPSIRYRYWQRASSSIEFSQIDELAGKSVSIRAALKPELDGTNFKFSETILRDCRAIIVAGAKYKLYMIPRKEWSDLNLAQVNENIFTKGSDEALRTRVRGFSRLPDKSVSKRREFY